MAKKRAKAYARGDVLTAEPMAKLLGTTWQGGLRRWCDLPRFEQSGCFVRGGQGIKWTFDVHKTIDWLIKYFEAEKTKLSAKVRKGEDIQNLPRGSFADDLDIADALKHFNLQQQIFLAEVEQRKWVRIEDVQFILTKAMTNERQLLSAMPSLCDPQGKLPPEFHRAINSGTDQAQALSFENWQELSRLSENPERRNSN
ncbi:hypothetical protein [Blastomonas fulva]